MHVKHGINILVLTAACTVLGACAPQKPQFSEGRRATLDCPAGQTMTCEVSTIGRIRHGTFARSTDRCACVHDDGGTLTTPVIPSTSPRQ